METSCNYSHYYSSYYSWGGGLLINQFQARDPHLIFTTEGTIPFEGLFENIAIYNVRVENDGNKIVDDVVCQLSFSSAEIQQSKLNLDPSITHNEIISGDSYRLELFNLNPEESAAISVLVSSTKQLPSRPDISLRGKGVIGVEASEGGRKGINWVVIVISTIAVYALSSTVLYTRRFRRTSKLFSWVSDEIDGSTHEDDQREILSYLCGIHQLNSEVERYLNISTKVSYWSEADRFALLALENPTGQDAGKRKKVLEDLLKYARVHLKSEGIIHYNIARIAKTQRSEEEANKHLEEAKRIIPKLIKTRIDLDPIWKEV